VFSPQFLKFLTVICANFFLTKSKPFLRFRHSEIGANYDQKSQRLRQIHGREDETGVGVEKPAVQYFAQVQALIPAKIRTGSSSGPSGIRGSSGPDEARIGIFVSEVLEARVPLTAIEAFCQLFESTIHKCRQCCRQGLVFLPGRKSTIPAQITREIFAHIAHKFEQGLAVADEAILDWHFSH
jgi:hypothetical protein